jgi:hypothetical protein
MSERLARLVWWWMIHGLRKAPVKNVNHKIARHLSPKHAEEFLRRGQQQNAFARRHAVKIIQFGINLLWFAFLCALAYYACMWLKDQGYFTAPGTPQRTPISPD